MKVLAVACAIGVEGGLVVVGLEDEHADVRMAAYQT